MSIAPVLAITGLRYTPMAYIIRAMEFIETPTFTRLLAGLLTDDEYAGLQSVLVETPDRGDIIKGGGGVRKLRYALAGRGKRGGCSSDLLLASRRWANLYVADLPEV